jgi:hypothetical protein
MAGAVVVAALAMVCQALLLLGLYRSSLAIRRQIETLSLRAESFFESTASTLEQSRRQISEVAVKTGQVLDLAHKQLVRLDDVMSEATARARVQMDRIELIMDDSLGRLHETTALLHKAVLRPVREITGLAAGIQTALSFLFRGQQVSVAQATHEDEMFI